MSDTLYFSIFILVLLRMVGFFATTPVFFPKGTPNQFKVAFVLIFSGILVPSINLTGMIQSNDMMSLGIQCLAEVSTGMVLGFLTNLCFFAVRMAGQYMDLQVGFGMISMFDPNANSNATFIERMMYWFSLITFIFIDGHHMIIREFVSSFDTVHIGKFILGQPSAMYIIKCFIQFFAIGIKIAVPIVLIVLVTDIILGLVARSVPQLNVMILGLPVKILIGLTFLSLGLPIIAKIMANSFEEIPNMFKGLFHTLPFIMIFASEDKTEEATPKKKSDARKKGQVAKSKEVSLAFTLLASTIILYTLGPYVCNSLKANIITFFTIYLNKTLSYNVLTEIAGMSIWRIALTFLPIGVTIMVIGVLMNFVQSGLIFTKEPLKPDFKKIDPINGLKKMFSIRTVAELVKDVLIVTIVGYIGYKWFIENYHYIVKMNSLTPQAIQERFLELIANLFFRITLASIAICLADYIFQKFQYKKDLKMSKQEIKEEFKQSEGDPQIKSKIRQTQREMAKKRMMQQVPNATVVITNPTHVAVALKYEEGKSEAPVLVAKGMENIAIKIKQIAKERDVPIIENKPLARLIYKKVELDSEIPVEMYNAVAEILALVYTMNKKKGKG